jgi:nucleotide-binding universal stress UspA family protein
MAASGQGVARWFVGPSALSGPVEPRCAAHVTSGAGTSKPGASAGASARLTPERSADAIVVGYDGSVAATAALRWALDEGRRLAAPVRLVYVLEWPVHIEPIAQRPAGWPDSQFRRDAEAVVEDAITDAARSDPDVTVRPVLLEGPVAATLCTLSMPVRMIVLGHRGRGGFSGLLLGSVSLAVAAHAQCPVVVVRGASSPDVGRDLHVAVGVDDSVTARLAVGFAFEEAASRGVGLVAVRAWQPPPVPWRTGARPLALDAGELETAERHALHEALEPWQRKYPAVPATARLWRGSPSHALVTESGQAQLVVVGSRGRGGFAGLLLVSVSQQLLHHAHCAVAVVREIRSATD